jgi:hypothetical protein
MPRAQESDAGGEPGRAGVDLKAVVDLKAGVRYAGRGVGGAAAGSCVCRGKDICRDEDGRGGGGEGGEGGVEI